MALTPSRWRPSAPPSIARVAERTLLRAQTRMMAERSPTARYRGAPLPASRPVAVADGDGDGPRRGDAGGRSGT
jgi:hypothetical protein